MFQWGRSILLVLVFSSLAIGCGSLPPGHFAAATPRFEPDKFFEGPVTSWGVVESRGGNPRSRLRADLSGRREGDGLVLTQDFTYEDGRRESRVWKIRRLDDHRYEASTDAVSGLSIGYAYGNTFHWEYSLEIRKGNPLSRVRMAHWMYLLGDGETVINRVVVRKFGVVIAQVTEYFRKGTESVPAIKP